MKKENKLEHKVKHLIKKLGLPRWLHHYGPKKYEFYEHLVVLLVRHYCKELSYRRTVKLFDLLGLKCASKSTLQYVMSRISKWIWDQALLATSGIKHHIVALDATGFSRRNPSYYYLRKIDGKMPRMHVKSSNIFDTGNQKWIAANIRVRPRHDTKDVRALLRNLRCNKLVADKGYDANWIHKLCINKKIEAHIPMRDKGKMIKHNHFSCRRNAAKKFKLRTYHRRELIESGYGSIKSKYGSSVGSKNAKTIRADIYCKFLCHNLLGAFSTT